MYTHRLSRLNNSARRYIYTQHDYRYKVIITCARLRLKTNVATDESKDRNET